MKINLSTDLLIFKDADLFSGTSLLFFTFLREIFIIFQEQEDMFNMIAAVLHLGNIQFGMDDDDASYVEDDNTYIKTASVSMNTGLIFIALSYGVLIRPPTC